MMRSRFLLIFCILLIIATYNGAIQAANNQILDHAILVNVNGKKITRSQLDTMGKILFEMHFPGRDETSINDAELEALSTNALKELIIIFLTEDEYDKIMNDDDAKNDFEITTSEVGQELRRMNIGRLINEPIAERYARTKIMRRNIVYSTRSNLDASPREVKMFYLKHKKTVFTEQRLVRVRQIFLSCDESNESLCKKQANMLYEMLKNNTIDKRIQLFPEMAKEFSRDKLAQGGGLIVTGAPGNFMPQDHTFQRPDGTYFFPKEMIQGIRDLNSRGDVILTKSDKGWHILLLEAIKGGRNIPFNKIRKIVENFIGDSKYEEAYYQWLTTKVSRNRITWNDGTPFPPDKITQGTNEEDDLRFLRNQLQMYMESLRNPNARR